MTTPGQDAAKHGDILAPCEHVTAHRVDGSHIGCTPCILKRVDAAVAEAVKETHAKYPLCWGDYERLRERMARAEQAAKERQAEADRYHGLLCTEIARVKELDSELANLRVLHEANCHYKRERDEARREERERIYGLGYITQEQLEFLERPPASAPEDTKETR